MSAAIWVWTVREPWPWSTVPTILAIAAAMEHELAPDYRAMTREPRSGDLLPDHLVVQLGSTEGHH